MAALPPQDLAFADRSPFRAEGRAECQASAEAVFAVLADHRRWPSWFGGGVRSVVPTSDPEHGVGATRTVTLRGLRVYERFIAWEEPTVFAFTGTEVSPRVFTKLVERAQIEPTGDGTCCVTYRMAFDVPMLLKPVAPLLAKAIGTNLTKAMASLASEAAGR